MKIKFLISEFNISGQNIHEDICDKILKYHISPMMDVREKLNIPIWPSQKSGFRSVAWEISKGRSGNSQHNFKGKGAVDWTCNSFNDNKNILLEAIIKFTEYTRITVYNSFIHCDYKTTPSGKRELYESGADSKWKFKKFI